MTLLTALDLHDGIINLDKPAGISSARAVARVKRLLPKGTKIGHAGTLDPFATGVLLLLVGRATRQCEALMNAPKQYEATVKLGATTATDDPESPELPFVRSTDFQPVQGGSDRSHRLETPATNESIQLVLPQFTGAIQQRPPAFSAMKLGGRRAYALARTGDPVELPPRTVEVYGIQMLSYAWPLLSLRIDCGRGTYIRAIARDLGAALGVGGYLTALRRTAIGRFRAEHAVSLEQLTAAGNIQQFIQPMEPQAGLASPEASTYNVPPDAPPSNSHGKDRT